MQRIYYLNTLRLLATFSVVLLHTSSIYYGNGAGASHDIFFLGFYKMMCQYAVPVFVLISGCIFLHPQKDTNYCILFKKYVKRIALAILIFGLPMCIANKCLTKE